MLWRRTKRGSIAVVLAVVCGVGARTAPARAEPLTQEERGRLDRGEVVRRTLVMNLAQGRYVGGVSYAIIHAPVQAVMRALSDVSAYKAMLPLTRSVSEVGQNGADHVIAIVHATKIGTAEYTCRVRRESGRLVRFWLEPSFPHDIEDLWGYFRVEPFGRAQSLLTYGAAMRLELGVVRLLFEDKIRDYALGTPALVRRYVEEHQAIEPTAAVAP